MKRSVQIILFATTFMLGIVLSANFGFKFSWWFVLAGAVILASSFLFKSKLGYVAIVAAAMLFGIARYEFLLANQPIKVDSLADQKVSVTGTVSGEPSWDQYRMYVFYISDVASEGRKYNGLIRVKSVAGVAKEGQQVQISGKAKAGLGKASILMSYADVVILNYSQPTLVVAKQTFLSGLDNTLSKTSSAFVAGTLVGSRSALPKNLQDLLSSTGLSHVVAVSGYNLTIIVALLARLLGKKWRWGSLIISMWLILGFVLISGANAAIVRAGVMSTVFLVASFYGRRVNLVVCMALTGLGMVLVSPTDLLSNIGWQLSFASLFGIATLAPKLSQILPKKPKWLFDILSITLAAQLATAGIIAYNFGTISIVAPLVNCIVMPAIPIIMAYGTLVAIFGIILPSLGGIIARPLDVTVTLMFDFLDYISHFGWASISVPSISVAMVVAYYSILSLWLLLGRSTDSKDFFEDNKNATMTGITTQPSKELSKVN